MFNKLMIIFLITACSTNKPSGQVKVENSRPKEFSQGELILGKIMLEKIFDQEMAPLACVPDVDEAALLLRTIYPRLEIVQDDLIAKLDDPTEVQNLIKNCHLNCTCGHLDELLREHLVELTKAQRKAFNAKKSEKELNRCLNYIQSTFCKGELFQTLNQEKEDFSYE